VILLGVANGNAPAFWLIDSCCWLSSFTVAAEGDSSSTFDFTAWSAVSAAAAITGVLELSTVADCRPDHLSGTFLLPPEEVMVPLLAMTLVVAVAVPSFLCCKCEESGDGEAAI
jgi:hypothetical protein